MRKRRRWRNTVHPIPAHRSAISSAPRSRRAKKTKAKRRNNALRDKHLTAGASPGGFLLPKMIAAARKSGLSPGASFCQAHPMSDIIPVKPDLAARAWINAEKYRTMYEYSIRDPN